MEDSYNEARAWLAFLIDHPDKGVSVGEYRAQIMAAQKVSQDAHNAMLEAWG